MTAAEMAAAEMAAAEKAAAEKAATALKPRPTQLYKAGGQKFSSRLWRADDAKSQKVMQKAERNARRSENFIAPLTPPR